MAGREIQVQARYTEAEYKFLESQGVALARRFSGLTKPDGSINISAVVRHLTLKGMRRG